MNAQDETHVMPSSPRVPIVWIVAVLLVIGAWAGAYALRGGGEKHVMDGWADGMPAGQRAAQDADKPMVVLFTAGWCGSCQVMKKKVLADPEVENILRTAFVQVQVDLTVRSSSNPNMAVAQQYGVQFLPTVVFMSPGGQAIEAYRGDFDDLPAFKAWLTRLE